MRTIYKGGLIERESLIRIYTYLQKGHSEGSRKLTPKRPREVGKFTDALKRLLSDDVSWGGQA